jgi:Domain of unknown function (DUF5069)
MTPLDLTKAPPRSPQEELGGLCMLPRMIDIARSKLPGGDIGQYQIGRGVSGAVLRHLGTDVNEFVEAVRNATTEEEVASRFCGARTKAEHRLLNLTLRRLTVADVPPDLLQTFEQFYGTEVPPERRVFDLLDEDDQRAFGAK